ncbi:MAG: DUF4384 domain-containing protein [Gemmatimonadales bacterium]|nr:DUF4384 domain-containing protein [Gemmatimonadales bacterium]
MISVGGAMFTALLLSILAAGDPVTGTRAQSNDDPPVQLWISNDRRFLPGDRARVHVRAEDDGYLVVLHADPDGHLRVMFPIDPEDDNFVRGGKKYEVHGRGGREAFSADAGAGRGTVYAAVSRAPFSFAGYVLGDHWDYRTLSPDRLPEDPETELTEIVRLMAGGSFDYDILSYDVIERVVYADNYSDSRSYYGSGYGSYYGSHYDDPWCSGYYFRRCGGGLSVGIFFGGHHRPYRHGYYSAYDPFFYDPYYYRPAYYYPYGGYYGYYRPYPRYRDYNSWPRYYGYARPYPYRFRDRDGFTADYRDRNYGFRRAVNTVYHPPITRVREPEQAAPGRRLVDDRSVASPTGPEARRDGDRREAQGTAAPRARSAVERPQPAVDRRQIEGRRAREPERMQNQAPERRARPAPRVAERPAPARAEPRTVDRGRVERASPPPPSNGGRSSAGSGGGDGGGRRRR